MRSKLEPGCKAIIVGTMKNSGKIVKIGNFVGKIDNVSHNDLWEVNQAISYSNGFIRTFHNLCPGQNLQRIDDDSEREEIREELTTEV